MPAGEGHRAGEQRGVSGGVYEALRAVHLVLVVAVPRHAPVWYCVSEEATTARWVELTGPFLALFLIMPIYLTLQMSSDVST